MTSQRTQGRPRAVKNILGDKVTAMTAAISILAALNEAQRSGKGQHLQIAMIDAVAYYLMPDTASRHTYLPHDAGIAPSMNTLEPFQTADGYITIAPLTDKHWTAILKAVGHPEWFEGDEPRPDRVRRSIKSLITLFPTQPSAYWLERIEAADVPCGPVNDYDSIWTDPQFVANETFFEYEHPKAGRVRAVRLARAILAHRARAVASSAGPGPAHRRNSRRVRIRRPRDFSIESESDRQLNCRSISRALTLTILAATIAILDGCATRQKAPTLPPLVVKAVPSAQPTATGAAVGTHSPFAITTGLDGNLWFTEFQGDGIGQMTPYGATRRFPIDPDGFAERITAGPDGAVWFTDTVGNRIGRVAPDGKIAYVKLPHSDSGPAGITLGPDGNLWFSEHSGDRIGRLSTIGTLTEIGRPKGTGPSEIVAGSDGNLWLAESKVNRIARVTISGNVKEYQLPTPDSVPAMMALGADGNVWFSEAKARKIGRITPGGYITEVAMPADAVPFGIASGQDKNLWITVVRAPQIYRLTPKGDFTAFPLPEKSMAIFITAGPDGNLWFTDPNGKIGRLTTAGDVKEFVYSNPYSDEQASDHRSRLTVDAASVPFAEFCAISALSHEPKRCARLDSGISAAREN